MKILTRMAFVVTLMAAFVPAMAPAAHADAKSLNLALIAAVPRHGDKLLGDINAPVVIIEFASASCPHCAEFHNNVMPMIRKDYIDTGKARLVFREFPHDQVSLGAFMLARCAPADRYFEMIDVIFKTQEAWTKDRKDGLYKIAADFGLASTDADACLKNKYLADSIYAGAKNVNKQFGIKEMPTILINGQFIKDHANAEAVKKAIDDELAKAAQ